MCGPLYIWGKRGLRNGHFHWRRFGDGWMALWRPAATADESSPAYLSIILKQQDDKRFEAALEHLRSLLKEKDIPPVDDSDRKTDQDHLDYLLNYYEFLCAAIWCGDVDEKLIRLCEETRLRNLNSKLSGYISDNRKTHRQLTLWKNLEDMAVRWGKRRQPSSYRMYEVYALKPCRIDPKWGRYVDIPAGFIGKEYLCIQYARRREPFWPRYRHARSKLR